MNSSIWDLMDHGGYAMWVIVISSVIALAVAIERLVAQWNFVAHAQTLAATVRRLLAKGAVAEARGVCERSSSPLADVFGVGFEKHGRTKSEYVATAVHRERQRVNQELRRRLWILATIGATAPFVGLAGTVLGLMATMGGLDPNAVVKLGEVSGPLSQALILTAAGIVVAVEAVVFFNYFNQRAGRIAVELKLLSEEFIEGLLDAPVEKVDDSRAEPDVAVTPAKGDPDGDRNAA
jgi:biopolymer transport protein ExbB